MSKVIKYTKSLITEELWLNMNSHRMIWGKYEPHIIYKPKIIKIVNNKPLCLMPDHEATKAAIKLARGY